VAEPSELDSGDSSRTRERKKRARKEWKAKLMRLKLEQSNGRPDPPFVYNGEPNFALFQKWVLEIRDWLRYSYIQRKHRVSRLKKYVGGRASTFYIRDIAQDPTAWTLRRFLEALFNYCFPANFRTMQREKYSQYSQRGHPIRDYRHDLEDLAKSVGDIQPQQLVTRFWFGADMYLRVKWAEARYDPERSTLDELVTSGE
jgi:hypothetical protein